MKLKTCSMTGKTAMIHHSKEPLANCISIERNLDLITRGYISQIYGDIKARSLVCATDP